MIITYYEQGHSKHSTANKFKIELKQLREWISKKPELMKVAPYIQKLATGTKPKYIELECTTIVQHLPETYNEEQSKFLFLILYKHHSYYYSLSLICNIDETAVFFNMTNTIIIEEKGFKTISIASTRYKHSMFTVVLACLAKVYETKDNLIFDFSRIDNQMNSGRGIENQAETASDNKEVDGDKKEDSENNEEGDSEDNKKDSKDNEAIGISYHNTFE
ncbi:4521_t:CDS:2 [Cetraspora pellucida]|uniref:4521_t:CDS:1 n=1 Tax=Cetraspora pellucida TaxID=1433469 RepID=A0ACA9KE42_9GLOM|nr:4521_t:CDS:2 [Cetraspora pellucida]